MADEEMDTGDVHQISAAKSKGRGITEKRAREKIVYESAEGVEGDVSQGPARSIEGWIIFITGLGEEASEEEITELFGEYGDIKNIHLNLDRRTGYNKYETQKEAQAAIDATNGKELLGDTISVDWCFVVPPSKTKK